MASVRSLSIFAVRLSIVYCVYCVSRVGCVSYSNPAPYAGHSLRAAQYYQFFSSGLTQLVWHEIGVNIENLNVTTSCKRSLELSLDAISAGETWAYRSELVNLDGLDAPFVQTSHSLTAVLDASGKTAAGILDGTVSSFGDYDQCLNVGAVTTSAVHGKHCMIKMQYDDGDLWPDEPPMQVDTAVKAKIPVFAYYYVNTALCVPSDCNTRDIATIVTQSECRSHTNHVNKQLLLQFYCFCLCCCLLSLCLLQHCDPTPSSCTADSRATLTQICVWSQSCATCVPVRLSLGK